MAMKNQTQGLWPGVSENQCAAKAVCGVEGKTVCGVEGKAVCGVEGKAVCGVEGSARAHTSFFCDDAEGDRVYDVRNDEKERYDCKPRRHGGDVVVFACLGAG